MVILMIMMTMSFDTHQYKLFITTGVMFIITKKRSETSLSMLHCPSYRLRLNSFSARAGAPLRPNTVRKTLKNTGFHGIEGRGVLPINFKSDTQTEEMGAGTTELLFQVLSTFISTWLIHHNHGTVFVFVVFCISLFAGSIYLYQHLTNLPQSPNWNVPLSPTSSSHICSLQPQHTYQ